MKICKEKGCDLKIHANGFCREHNDYYWRKPSYKAKFKKKCLANNCTSIVCKSDYCPSHQKKIKKGLNPNIKYNKGKYNHNWNGGISQYPNHNQMKKIRKTKLESVGSRCEECKIKKPSNKLDLHHIDGSKDNHVLENFQLLCHKCHMSIYHSGSRRPYKGNKKHDIAYLKTLIENC